MATFSQQFLSNLGNPTGMLAGAAQLGQALGSAPGLIAEAQKATQKKEEEEKTTKSLMTAISNQDPVKLEQVAEQLRSIGQYERAVQVQRQAQALREKNEKREKKENLKKAENNLIDWATDTSTDLNNPDSRAGFFRAAGRLGISTERAFELFEKFVEPKQEPVVLSQGSYLVYPETGEVVARAPVKETITHKIIPSSKTDPNIRVFENGVQIEVIPVYAGETEQEAGARLAGVAKLVNIKQSVKKLMGPDYQASGFDAALFARWWPGSTAYDRKTIISSVRANLGLEAIQELKRMSERGSTGLGAVSNIELDALQSAVASLDIGMSESAQREALVQIFNHLDRAQKAMAGVQAKDTIDWNSPSYMSAGFSLSEETNEVYYAPTGPDGKLYRLDENGQFVPVED